jgi:hypothetical protein
MDTNPWTRPGGLIVALSVGLLSLGVGACRRGAGPASSPARAHWVWTQPLDRGTVLHDEAMRADLASGRDDRVSYALAMLASTRGGAPVTPEGEPALAEVLPILRRFASDPGGPWAHEALQALAALLPLPRAGSPTEAERIRAVEWLATLATDVAQDAQVRAIAIEALASQSEGAATLQRVVADHTDSVHLRLLATRALDPRTNSRVALAAVSGRETPQDAEGDRVALRGALERVVDTASPDWADIASRIAMAPGQDVPTSEEEWLTAIVATERDGGRHDPSTAPPHFFWSAGDGTRATAMTAVQDGLRVCADNAPSACVRFDGIEPRVRAGRCDDPRCERVELEETPRQALRILAVTRSKHPDHCFGGPESMVVRE